MNRTNIKRAACLISWVFILTGCSAFQKLDQPYDFAQRTAFASSIMPSDKAAGFADQLCVVTEKTPSSDGSVTAEAAAVFGLADEKAFFGKNPFEKLYPASITKVMTALLALKYGNTADEVTVPLDAVITEPGATLCGIKPGDKLTMEQLLYGLLLPSGNDAAAAIAVHMDGSVEEFAHRMNQEARRLGATGTHFVNPHGLHDENHYTTAYDLYLIFNEALKYPEFRKIIGSPTYTAMYTLASGETATRTWDATNLYMTGSRKLPKGLSLLGGKTGTTKAAGNCLIMESQDEAGKDYISVVLKAPDKKGLYDNMTHLLNKVVD